ncbi:hypothetical protein CPB83DRAFT_400946 [Crepidotus variabilis]|uniref:BZIP domain-containing protein n=1 Tax=Crepidotus variabilis TaxID=179855 RepID=A0A9P6EEA0_9AGAR|nr:hypothetical protein CPB83DRAFT_400946 [Crepidotus variabilis]
MPTNIQGLNIVHTAAENSSADSQDLLLGQAYPDLSAQLDLWTNLNFDSDEPLGQRASVEHKNSLKLLAEEQEEEIRSPVTGATALRDGHANVVTPTNNVQVPTPQNQGLVNPAAAIAAAAAAAAATQQFDLNAFLASFGIDAFSTAAAVQQPQQQQQQHLPLPIQQPQHQAGTVAPSLAQLLALHNMGFPSPGMPQYQMPPAQLPIEPSLSRGSAPSTITDSSNEDPQAPAKRSRTRKTSITTVDSPDERSSTTSPPSAESSSANLTTPLSASEDKRRRNTAASARFRLKKKEREAALEGKAKELETKVLELERECEGLRRENGWLKGLVVGVTGVAAQPPPSTSKSVSAGTKRSRDDAERA